MRIGIFTNCYKPMINGVVGTVSLLRKGFLEAGHKVYVFSAAFGDYKDEEEGIYRYPAVNLTSKVTYPVAIPYSPQISRVTSRLQLDIVHCHQPFVLGPLALRLARRRSIPAVFTFHTRYDQYTHYVPLPRQLVKWVARWQVKRFSQAVDLVTTPAESAQHVLLDYGVTNRIRVVANPIDNYRFESANAGYIREKYHLRDNRILINIGRIAPEKNLALLLNAFKYILAQTPDRGSKLIIVGDGPGLDDLKQLAWELAISDSVIFIGMVKPVDIPGYLAAADLFVMTSTTEVRPLVLLESLASGLPIVAVAAAGVNDTISHGENGLLTIEDPQEIAAAVLGLIRNPERLKSLQKNARQKGRGYAYTRIAGEYLTLFAQLIK